jgi:hypothetical protein
MVCLPERDTPPVTSKWLHTSKNQNKLNFKKTILKTDIAMAQIPESGL